MAHEDVVPAEAEHWTEPPFDGVVKDGYIWGRGAIDVKNLLAAFCVALRRLAEEGRDFAGEVVFVAEADEEDGAIGGARWLCEQRPDLVPATTCSTRAAASFSRCRRASGSTSCTVGEKGTAQFRVVVSGESGHASVPLRRGNAVVGAADVVRALHDYEPRLSLETVPRSTSSCSSPSRRCAPGCSTRAPRGARSCELSESDRRTGWPPTCSRRSTASPSRRPSSIRAARR